LYVRDSTYAYYIYSPAEASLVPILHPSSPNILPYAANMDAQAVVSAWEACDKTDTLFILVCSVFCWVSTEG